MTSGDVIGWGLAALLWLGVTVGAIAVLFGACICFALATSAIRHAFTR